MSKIQANLSVPNYSGAEGYITKAVTGTITAKELGEELKAQQQKTPRPAAILNSDSETFDLLKKESRLPELKMAMALHLLMSGQVFISAGDEIGLQKDKVAVISDAMVVPAEETEQSGGKKTEDKTGESLDLVFGSMADQNKNGNSLLNFVRQAVLLRDSFIAASSGSMTVLDDLTTDQVLAVKKDADGSSVVLVYNLSNSPVQVDTSSVQILGLPCELGGVLLTDANEITFENNILSMPAYSAAVLK